MKKFFQLGFLLAFCCTVSGGDFILKFGKKDFDRKARLPKGWHFRGKLGTPKPEYEIVVDPETKKEVLRITAVKASGTILHELPKGILKKYPVMRWKWRMISYPDGADGRDSDADDQGIAIYVGAGGIFSNRSYAYRWETETPKGHVGTVRYAGGLAYVVWLSLRNKSDGKNKWIVEECNVADDLKKLFNNKIPDEAALSISSNSQYTKTTGKAELEYIEFIPAANAKTSKESGKK